MNTFPPLQARRRPGFLMIEVLLGIAVFALFIGALGLTFVNSNISSQHGGNMHRALQFAEEALEAARSMRDEDFSLLVDGTHGYALNGAGLWRLSGGSTAKDGYVIKLTLYHEDAYTVVATAETQWGFVPSRDSTVTLRTKITALHSITKQVRDWSQATVVGSCIGASCTAQICGSPPCPSLSDNSRLADVVVSNQYAYVSADVGAGGAAGLYIFDVSDTTTPKLMKAFPLGAGVSGGDLALRGDTLYLLTDEPASEIRAYGIDDPLNPVLITSYDFPGSGTASTLALDGDHLYVGGFGSPTEPPASSSSSSAAACVDPGSMSQTVPNQDPMTWPAGTDAYCDSFETNCYTNCVRTGSDCTCTGRRCSATATCGWVPPEQMGVDAPVCSCDGISSGMGGMVRPPPPIARLRFPVPRAYAQASSIAPPDPYVCSSPAWPGISYTIPYRVRPGGGGENGSDVQCFEQCDETNPRRHKPCFGGLQYPFCFRAPDPSGPQVIAGQTEQEYLQTHTFGGGQSWNSTDDCDGKCTPPPQQTSVICDANQSPFIWSNGAWVPNCNNGVCQQPTFDSGDASNPYVLCAPDVRMTQCGLDGGNTPYAFVPDGGPCDNDSQCYRGPAALSWRPYPSACVANVCMPDMSAASSSSGGSCTVLNAQCVHASGSNPPGFNPCCSGLTCVGYTCQAQGTVGLGNDFFTFDIANRLHINYLDSIWTGGVNAVSISTTGAFLTGPKANGEVVVVNITDAKNLVKEGEYNMSDRSGMGTAIHRVGDDLLVGTGGEDDLEEFLQLDASGNQVPPVNPVYSYNASGTVMDVTSDEEGVYGFIANTWHRRPLEVVCLKNAGTFVPEEFTWPSSGVERPSHGLFYDVPNDQLYFTTIRGLYIFSPGLGLPTCP